MKLLPYFALGVTFTLVACGGDGSEPPSMGSSSGGDVGSTAGGLSSGGESSSGGVPSGGGDASTGGDASSGGSGGTSTGGESSSGGASDTGGSNAAGGMGSGGGPEDQGDVQHCTHATFCWEFVNHVSPLCRQTNESNCYSLGGDNYAVGECPPEYSGEVEEERTGCGLSRTKYLP